MLEDILSIIERDPDSRFAAEARLWADEIRLGILERQMDLLIKFGTPSNDFERSYVTARKAEQDIDANPLAAVERYHRAVEHVDTVTNPPGNITPDQLPIWKVLFDRRLSVARENVLKHPDVREHFVARMEHAQELDLDGSTDEARQIWEATATLYRNVDSVADFQRYALRRRNGRPLKIPPLVPELNEEETPLDESAELPPDAEDSGGAGEAEE